MHTLALMSPLGCFRLRDQSGRASDRVRQGEEVHYIMSSPGGLSGGGTPLFHLVFTPPPSPCSQNHCCEWARIEVAGQEATEDPGKVLDNRIGVQILFLQVWWETDERFKQGSNLVRWRCFKDSRNCWRRVDGAGLGRVEGKDSYWRALATFQVGEI